MASFPKGLQILAGSALLIAGGATLTTVWTHAKASNRQSYLGATVQTLGDRVPPPVAGPGAAEAERRVFRATRELQGSLRWKQAANDADQSAPALMRAFSCASGISLSPEQAPHLTSLLAAAGADAAHIAHRAKSRFRRPRPYVLDEGPTCGPTAGLGDFHDYPSGHSTRGWTWAFVLAQLLPDRRQQLMSRAQAYADSRVVCGFHSPTGVRPGRALAMLTVTSLNRNPKFTADLQQASQELTALKQHGDTPPAGQCQSELSMMKRPY